MPIEWADGVVDASGLPLHYLRGGFVGGPVVVLLHGFTDNAGCWQRVADALAPTTEVVAIDARNHGTSGTAVGSLADTADDVGAVIDALALGPVDLVGHSLGACTAIELAVRRKPLVRRLVLEDPPWRSSARTEDVAERRARLLDFVRSFAGHSIDEIVDLGREQYPGWDALDLPAWALAKQQVRREAIETISTQPWHEIVPQVVCPTLLIHGEPSLGGVVGPKLASEAAALNPRFSASPIAGAGHNVHRECFDAYMAAVAPFLAIDDGATPGAS